MHRICLNSRPMIHSDDAQPVQERMETALRQRDREGRFRNRGRVRIREGLAVRQLLCGHLQREVPHPADAGQRREAQAHPRLRGRLLPRHRPGYLRVSVQGLAGEDGVHPGEFEADPCSSSIRPRRSATARARRGG